MSKRSSFEEYESESQVQKLIKKSKDSPFVPLGKVKKSVKWILYFIAILSDEQLMCTGVLVLFCLISFCFFLLKKVMTKYFFIVKLVFSTNYAVFEQ